MIRNTKEEIFSKCNKILQMWDWNASIRNEDLSDFMDACKLIMIVLEVENNNRFH